MPPSERGRAVPHRRHEQDGQTDINHAGQRDQRAHHDAQSLCLLLEEGSLIVRIRDDGAPFDPLAFVDDEEKI